MSEVQAEVVGAEVEGAESKEPLVGKELIYATLGNMVKEMTGKRIGKTGGRKLFDKVVEMVFVEAAAAGTFRFNAGYGSMHVKTYASGSRRLPSGQEVTFGERKKLRYEEGVMVEGLVATQGNLEAVQASRKVSDDGAATDPVADPSAVELA